ncbi:hypothetical protein WIW50_03205 [Flavobacteriaceae bacterium 3-367]|uniref:hypothetical protein n=1 Tax=Eudoraea algarum TaxID=3417568 RepID=UPI0032849856
MRTSVFFWVIATTLVLILVTATASMGFPFNWVFYLTVAGQLMLVYMVYRVLTDGYTTEKTFEDFYEDRPLDR